MEKSYKYITKTITIRANPGVYVFDGYAASGKTYLGKILKKLNSAKVIRFRMIRELEDFNQDLINEINSGTIEIVFFDRFDFYGSQDMILRFKEVFDKTVFLVDCKDIDKLDNVYCSTACIDMGKDFLKVYGSINI